MINRNLKLKTLFVAICCFALVIVIPVSARGQLGGVVQGAKHGIQKGVEKTKEGAESIGRSTKKVITREHNDQNTNRMKPSETQPETSTTETQPQQTGETERTKQTATEQTERREQKRLPKTAGELPLLVLVGCFSLVGAYTVADRSGRSRS
jgi:hypothetical protein